MNISASELFKFANDPANEIEMGQCDTNAIKVYERFRGEIYIGEATYVNPDGTRSNNGHFWNVLKYKLNSGEEVIQLVDIINYKSGTSGIYINHRDAAISSIARRENASQSQAI